MGTIYYGVCHDCFEYIDLDKFYAFAAYGNGNYADIEKENLKDFGTNEGWVYRSLRLQFFLSIHQGHRLGVYNEHEWQGYDYETADQEHKARAVERALTDSKERYKEVCHWPTDGRSATDTIDWSDPKAGRLTIKTRYGEIVMDYRSDGVNCFRQLDGKRVDTLLLLPKSP